MKQIVTDNKEKQPSTTLLGVYSGFFKENSADIRSSSAILSKTTGPIMVYSNGDQCWNGPDRIVYVAIECGLENKIVKVAENGN